MAGSTKRAANPRRAARSHRAGRARAGSNGSTGDEIGYGGPQVCKIVGHHVPPARLLGPHRPVRPSLADAKGSGTQRRYSYRDLVALKVIKSLLDAGVSLQTARKAIEYLRDHLGEDLASARLVLDGTRSVLVRTGDDIVDLVRHGQGVLNIVPLGRSGRAARRRASTSSRPTAVAADAPVARRGRAASAGGGG